MPELVTLGQKTYYNDYCFADPWGPKPDVLLIQHGYGRNANFWYPWVPRIGTKYRLIIRDLRGHGLSSAPSRDTYDWSLETMLAEIIDMLDQLKIEKVHFLGESASGMIGIALAAKYPHRLHSLITCSTPSHLPPGFTKFAAFGYKDWPECVRTLGSEGWARKLASTAGTGLRAGEHEDEKAYLAWWISEIGKSSTYGLEQFAVFAGSMDSRPFLKDVKVPTLILAPTKSPAASIE